MVGAGFADFFIIFFFFLGAADFASSLVVSVVLEIGAVFWELDRRWQAAPAGWEFIPDVDFFAFLSFFFLRTKHAHLLFLLR